MSLKHVTEYLDECFQERAGIVEFCAGRTREEAEAVAKSEVDERRVRMETVDRDKVQQ